MTEKIKNSLRDSKTARWVALGLISLTMFFAYFFVDVAAPLKGSLERYYGWSNQQFGWLGGSEFILNVMGFLILSGIILDKMGIRFTLRTSAVAMFLGGGIKFFALSFIDTSLVVDIFGMQLPTTALLSYVGFAIFGIGVEMAGITVSKTIVKWFRGKELALAMGLEMAIARLGVFAVFQLSPRFAGITESLPYGDVNGVKLAMIWAMAFLTIGALSFLVYTFMDAKLDKETGETLKQAPEDEFKFSDLGKILKNPGFLAIAGLCVLFYSAIFPFQKFAAEMLSSKLDVSMDVASSLFSWFPIGAMLLTPIIGYFLDKRGYGASLMFFGAVLLVISHLIFALVPAESFNMFTAVLTIVVLGTAFSLVPASMWPSIPKIIEDKLLGSAYGLIFWIQNIGLMAVPVLIGWALTASNPGVAETIAAGGVAKYDYTIPEFIFAGFGVLAMVLALVLKAVDKKNGYGLELPNIVKKNKKDK
ncbi:MAG: MFS transporter [Bacteroidales bacterium]|nr:MFS transporter [Bacteroidales bacterium]MDD4216862.1 MFS transporter [Bacteroidales bacterium]MDY0141924.1 MFS transporter [Bacteroidales bacterium]